MNNFAPRYKIGQIVFCLKYKACGKIMSYDVITKEYALSMDGRTRGILVTYLQERDLCPDTELAKAIYL